MSELEREKNDEKVSVGNTTSIGDFFFNINIIDTVLFTVNEINSYREATGIYSKY